MKNLVDEIRAELVQIRADANVAAASHATRRYDNLAGQWQALVWCLNLICGESE